MNNRELLKIIEEIKTGEPTDLKAIAATAEVDRANLSTLLNAKEVKKVSPTMEGKIKRAYPSYFAPKVQHNANTDGYKEKYITLLEQQIGVLNKAIEGKYGMNCGKYGIM